MPTLVDAYTIREIEQPVSISTTGAQKTILIRYLDTNGSGAGTKNAVGEYHDAGNGAEIFYIQPPPGAVYRIARLLPFVEDQGTFDSGSYGNGITLTNGISIRVQNDSGTIVDLLDGLPIKLNTHWARICYDMSISSFGTGNEYLHARWTFAKSGQMIRLVGDNNERLEVVLNDDFSDLVSQYFMVQGYIE
jgi:hypothetical protein